MKLMIVTNLYPPHVLGGYEILCHQVVEALRRRGHDVTVLTSDHGVGAEGPPEGEKHVHRALRLFMPFDRPAGAHRLRRFLTSRHNYRVTAAFLRRDRPELVFVWSQLRLTLGAARAAQDTGVPTVFTLNDEHLAGYAERPCKGLGVDVARWLVDSVLLRNLTLRGLSLRHATCISDCVRRNLVRQGVPVEDARVIYQGIPLERFPCKADPGGLHDALRLLYVGQLHAYKGVHTLIEAAHVLAERLRRDVRVTVAGRGPIDYEERLKQQAGAGPAMVDFLGQVPHDRLPGLYREHDVFIFPSIWQEPFGLTHLEAMASGLPLVSTADGGHGEFLADGQNALIFPPGDTDALVDRLERLARDAALRRRLARDGRAHVATHLTLEHYVDQLEQMLGAIREETSREHRARSSAVRPVGVGGHRDGGPREQQEAAGHGALC